MENPKDCFSPEGHSAIRIFSAVSGRIPVAVLLIKLFD